MSLAAAQSAARQWFIRNGWAIFSLSLAWVKLGASMRFAFAELFRHAGRPPLNPDLRCQPSFDGGHGDWKQLSLDSAHRPSDSLNISRSSPSAASTRISPDPAAHRALTTS